MRRALASVFLFACGGGGGTNDAGLDASSSDVVTDVVSDVASAQSSGTRTVAACATLDAGSETCGYTFVWDPTKCTGRACKRLVIYFSGGQESCPALTDSTSYLARYASLGYVAVCARDWNTAAGSDSVPRHLEAPRIDAVVRAITSDADVLAGWSGDYLLFSGVSHGASGPVIAMATTTFDDQPSWKGSTYTGACFDDGTYDATSLIQLEYDQGCTQTASVLSYERVYSRYCPWSGDGDTKSTWPLPSTCATSDVAADTIVSIAPTNFAIKDWKLVECGSALPLCSGPMIGQDALSKTSIQALCANIAAAPGYTCAGGSFPNVSHILCGTEATSRTACSDWFESQLTSHGFQ